MTRLSAGSAASCSTISLTVCAWSSTYLNELNQALLDRIQRSGQAFVSNAVVGGRYVLRACIVNIHTRAEDIDALPEIVVRLGREVDGELRGRTE